MKVGETIARLEAKEGASAPAAPKAEEKPAEEAPKQEAAPAQQKTVEEVAPAAEAPQQGNQKQWLIASPAARKAARERGIKLDQVPTTDPLGRVRKHDIDSYADQKSNEQKQQAQASKPAKPVSPSYT